MSESLVKLIISKDFEIETNQETRIRLQQKLYSIINSITSDAEAGHLIGKLSSDSGIGLSDFSQSYDFFENYFSEVEIQTVPEDVSISFLCQYLCKEFPNFLTTVYCKEFSVDKLSVSVKEFLCGICGGKRQYIFTCAFEASFFEVALLVLVSSEEVLDLPCNEPRFVPFLFDDLRYKDRIRSMNWLVNQSFVDFFYDCVSVPEVGDELILFVTATGKVASDFTYEVVTRKIAGCTTLEFYLALKSLENVGLNPDLILLVAKELESLPPINETTQQALVRLTLKTVDLCVSEICFFVSNFSLISSPFALNCLGALSKAYSARFSPAECLQIRNALSESSTSSFAAFDEGLASKFSESRDFDLLLKLFPNAAAKWFKKCGDLRIRSRVERLSSKLIAATLDELIARTSQNAEFQVVRDGNVVRCDYNKDGDVFSLKIALPKAYPLEPPTFEMTALGNDRITHECRDEIIREAIRPMGLFAAVSLWNSKVMTVVRKQDPCPICLSFLDGKGEAPRLRCWTCHQGCHASCLKGWTVNYKNTCPRCRGLFKRPKSSLQGKSPVKMRCLSKE
jgi:hypothetical protein